MLSLPCPYPVRAVCWRLRRRSRPVEERRWIHTCSTIMKSSITHMMVRWMDDMMEGRMDSLV